MIIDFHTHFGIAHNTKYTKGTIDLLLNSVPNIKKILCSSLSGIFDRETAEQELSYVIENKKVIGVYWLNPYLPKWEIYANKFCEEHNIYCIKLSPTANIYSPTEKFLEPVWKFCSKTKKFIVIHTDEFRSNPLQFAGLVKYFSDVKVVLYHLDNTLPNIRLAQLYSNVYLETSFCEKTVDLVSLRMAYELIGADRLLFGTDFPIGFNRITKQYIKQNYADLKILYKKILKKDASKVLFYNAENLLKKYDLQRNVVKKQK
jgi:predicted TIM-barrel fold metal-dependent hydrolase